MKKIPIPDPVEIDLGSSEEGLVTEHNLNVSSSVVQSADSVDILNKVLWRCKKCGWQEFRPDTVIVRKCPDCDKKGLAQRVVWCPAGCFFIFEEEELGPRDVGTWEGKGCVKGGIIEC